MRWLWSCAGMRAIARLIIGPAVTVSSSGTFRRAHCTPLPHAVQCSVEWGAALAAEAALGAELTRSATSATTTSVRLGGGSTGRA